MSRPDPSHILQVGMGFFASKTLLSAVELELFTKLSSHPMTGKEIAAALQLNPRAIPDLPDALVAIKVLEREGNGPDARYSNTPDSAFFGPKQPWLHRRHPRDGECSPISILGGSHRGP